MKKYRLIIIFALIYCMNGYAQRRQLSDIQLSKADNIQSDSINLSLNTDFEKKAGLTPIDKTAIATEVRFYKLNELSGTRSLKIVAVKDSEWTAVEYAEQNKPIKIKKYKLKAEQSQLRSLMRLLLKHNLAYLPNQAELEPKMKKYADTVRGRAEQKIIVSDGESYTVEFKIGDTFRIFRFHNPKTYSDFYDNVQELKDYVAIVSLFENQLKRE
ncbi:hypothetical protein [uncultured Pontibacter sp.]|uniref:hypothetical protein n=1 Tax=uncultured Pontibacter sp. TaxID=453356 RepID=UPI0026049047|nr:hypothetical protein [uncultured Pontibacter sp.]